MKRCLLCHAFKFDNENVCNKCADKATEIVCHFEQNGILEITDNKEFNLFVMQVINSRKK